MWSCEGVLGEVLKKYCEFAKENSEWQGFGYRGTGMKVLWGTVSVASNKMLRFQFRIVESGSEGELVLKSPKRRFCE